LRIAEAKVEQVSITRVALGNGNMVEHEQLGRTATELCRDIGDRDIRGCFESRWDQQVVVGFLGSIG